NGDVARPRKKTAKRRVVELSRGDGSTEMFTAPEIAPRVSPAHFEHHSTPPKATSSFGERPRMPISPPSSVERNSFTVGEAPPTPPGKDQHHPTPPAVPLGEDWSQKGDEYKRKIEALKNEVGSGWLTVLSDDNWDGARRATPSPSTASQLS